MTLEQLQNRADIIREIRSFFESRQYLAVDTPLLAPDLIPENCLEVFETSWLPVLYDLIFIHAVEPSLPKDRPVVLLDYPAFVPCLAKNKKSSAKGYAAKERWELYINGVELANCYSEETNPQELRRFFEEEAKSKEQNALVNHNINHDYWKYLRPADYSGVAMGLDRLIMLINEKNSIESILPFSF
ncbi:MAG: hypothetical protein FWG29_00995 [Treponema sp.]|nr:hypothetical protein [Treponema sp.]